MIYHNQSDGKKDLIMNIKRNNVAKVNDRIQWCMNDKSVLLEGTVEKVYDNSVIVNLSTMPNFSSLNLEEKTVVSHKRYVIVS